MIYLIALRRVIVALTCIGTTICTVGCMSGVHAVEVTGKEAAPVPGVRYYLPIPYLIIEELQGKQWDARLELGVDSSHQFAVDPYTWFGATTTEMEFNADGTLKSFKLNQDETTVSDALVNGLKDVALQELQIQQQLQQQSQNKPAAAKKDNTTPQSVNRGFYIYAIRNGALVPSSNNQTGSIPVLTAGAGNQNQIILRIRLDDNQKQNVVVQHADTELSDADKAALKFYKGDGTTVSDTSATSLRNAAKVTGGDIWIPKDQIDTAGVKQIEVKGAKLDVPPQ